MSNNDTPEPLLRVENLVTTFDVEGTTIRAVDRISFDIQPGEVLGLVGESGCGKSVTSLSILKLIPDPPGKVAEGEIWFRGQNLLDLSYDEMREIRGRDISMIFQEPMTSLNPVFSIGWQMRESIIYHLKCSKAEAHERAVEMLELVGISDAANRMKNYPHEFSGGMRQRVMIAMALSLNPALLIADEPTTALDVTIQAQILELMLEMKNRHDDASILLITHDLAVVAETCNRVVVMYAGRIQEVAPVKTLFREPLHPYTRGLIRSLPRPELERVERLETIPGMVPSLFDLPKGCRFCTRCADKIDRCETEEPELRQTTEGHWVRCHLVEEEAAK